MTDRSRYAGAAVLLPIVGSWLVADVARGNWGRVVFQVVLAMAVVVAVQTLTRLPKGPQA